MPGYLLCNVKVAEICYDSKSPSILGCQASWALSILIPSPPYHVFTKSNSYIKGVHILRNTFDNGTVRQAEISNNIAIFVDSENGRDATTRRPMYFICVVIAGVIVDHVAQQLGAIALHSTDAEIYGFCSATKRAVFWYDLAVFFELPTAGDAIKLYEDSQPCIDVVKSNSISSRVKHLAVQVRVCI